MRLTTWAARRGAWDTGCGWLHPDVVAMDVRMPLMDGIEATRAVLRTVPDPPKIVVVTTFENDAYVYGALRAGADGFLLERARPAEIVHALRAVAAGDSLLFPSAVRELAAAHAQEPGSAEARETLRRAALTDREGQVLRMMARGQRGDRHPSDRRHRDRQVPRQRRPVQTRRPRPHPGGHRRVRVGLRLAGLRRGSGGRSPSRPRRPPPLL
ncbi:response regulator transcription factor [Streptomyces albidoflavus]|nr:response regulator transcription factor [Streptomyces albidoflavus]